MTIPDVVYGVVLGAFGYHIGINYIWPWMMAMDKDVDDDQRD